MPYKSKAQAGYFHEHKTALEREGVNVAEWDAASKGKKLPRKITVTVKHRNKGRR